MKHKNKIDKVKSSGKKMARILVLLGLREGYLLTRNLYGILEHPKLTMGRIVKQRDLSQGLLIFGLPAGLWLGWIFVLLVSRLFIFGRLQFGFLAKTSFLFVSFSISLLLLLLGYCFYAVWKKGRRSK